MTKTFREQAEEILTTNAGRVPERLSQDLDALTALHEEEVKRIIGGNVKPGDYLGDSSKERSYDTYENVIKDEQRRRAGIGEKNNGR